MKDEVKDQAVQAGFEQRRVFDELLAHDVMHHGSVYGLLRRIFWGLRTDSTSWTWGAGTQAIWRLRCKGPG